MITMSLLDYTPVIGSMRFVERASNDEVPFSIRVEDAVQTGFVTGMQLIGTMHVMGPTYGMVRVAQAVSAATPTAVLAGIPMAASGAVALAYDRKVSEKIRETHHRTPYYGPFAGAFGPVV